LAIAVAIAVLVFIPHRHLWRYRTIGRSSCTDTIGKGKFVVKEKILLLKNLIIHNSINFFRNIIK
jgi:hypothetical protein